MALIWLGGAWLAGIVLAHATARWWPVPVLVGAVLVVFAALYPEYRRRLVLLLLLPAIVAAAAYRTGLARASPAQLPPGTIEAVRGTVVDWPLRGGRDTRATLRLTAARVDGRWNDASGQVRLIAPLYPELWRGDQLELTGYYRPLEELPWRAALERRGQYGEFRAFVPRVVIAAPRDELVGRRFALVTGSKETLLRAVAQPQAGLITGVLLGDTTLLPVRSRLAFSATGTSHIMALSGWNIALVAGALQLLGTRMRRARSLPWLLGSTALIWAYTMLVGGGPTIVRAAIMGTLYLLATATGRRGDPLTALVVAATAMTAVAPSLILDIGFQLSCAATAGMVLLSGRLARAWGRVPPLAREGLAATVAAELFTLPLVMHYFGRASLVTLPANLLVEPLVPLVMLSGTLTVLAGALPLSVAALVGLVAWLPAQLLLVVVERLGALPWASVPVPPFGWGAVAAAYATMAAVAAGVAQREKPRALLAATRPPALWASRRALTGFATSSAVLLWLGLLARWLF